MESAASLGSCPSSSNLNAQGHILFTLQLLTSDRNGPLISRTHELRLSRLGIAQDRLPSQGVQPKSIRRVPLAVEGDTFSDSGDEDMDTFGTIILLLSLDGLQDGQPSHWKALS